MLWALGEPLDSGVMNPAMASGANTRAAPIAKQVPMRSWGARRPRTAAMRWGRKARHSSPAGRPPVGAGAPYTGAPLRVSRAIRVTAWALVAAGVAAPALRRRLRLPPVAVLVTSGLSPLAVCVAVRRSRGRDVGVCLLNMWAYIAAYEMPHDDPQRLTRRAHLTYPLVADRILGLGETPTVRLQRAFSAPGRVKPLERVRVLCHWAWFLVPHGSLLYILVRRPERFAAAAARMYAVFDVGAIFYWTIPTAPPWWASAQGQLPEE